MQSILTGEVYGTSPRCKAIIFHPVLNRRHCEKMLSHNCRRINPSIIKYYKFITYILKKKNIFITSTSTPLILNIMYLYLCDVFCKSVRSCSCPTKLSVVSDNILHMLYIARWHRGVGVILVNRCPICPFNCVWIYYILQFRHLKRPYTWIFYFRLQHTQTVLLYD